MTMSPNTNDPPRKAVFFFCPNLALDPVAAHILAASRRQLPLAETKQRIDGALVLRHTDARGNSFDYVSLGDVLSHDYRRFAPVLEMYSDADFAVLVNWHAGQNAPDSVLTCHTTGDVASGVFGAVHPLWTRNTLLALEAARRELGLDTFTTVSEATHWSGVPHQGEPEWIRWFPVPLVDVEIGSSPRCWSDPSAAEAVARALPRVFDPTPDDARVVLCLGGVHVERAFCEPILATAGERRAFAPSHILPNHWLMTGGYDTPVGMAKIEAALASTVGPTHAIVFHDNLKGPIKAAAREVAARRGIPAFRHQALREPARTGLWPEAVG